MTAFRKPFGNTATPLTISFGFAFFRTRPAASSTIATSSTRSTSTAAYWISPRQPLKSRKRRFSFALYRLGGKRFPDESVRGISGVQTTAGFRTAYEAGELQQMADHADFGAVHAALLFGRFLGPRQRRSVLSIRNPLAGRSLEQQRHLYR